MAKTKVTPEFKQDSRNANRGTDRGRAMVEASLREVGAGRSIVSDRDGRIIAGNKTLAAAEKMGLKLRVIETDGRELVVVQRNDLDLTDDTGPARKMAWLDNRASEVGLAWDAEVLLADLNNGLSFDGIFDKAEIDALLAGLVTPEPVQDVEPDISKADELQKKWSTSLGQIWQMGKHRLAVGDSTDGDTVNRLLQGQKVILMVTDPPYGVDYDPDWRNDAAEKGLISYGATNVGKVANDDRVDWTATYKLVDAQVAYVWHAGLHAKEVQGNLEDAGYQMVSQIIWAKPSFAISRGDYHWKHEPCWYAVKKGKNHNWQGSRSESTLWEISRGTDEKTGHGTEKPIECMAKPIRNNTQIGETVCDPFMGSGTTLIACEQLNRICFGIEIDLGYTAVILERWHLATNQMPVLLSDATGQTPVLSGE